MQCWPVTCFSSFSYFWHDNRALTFPETANLLSTYAVMYCMKSLLFTFAIAIHLCWWLYGKSCATLVTQNYHENNFPFLIVAASQAFISFKRLTEKHTFDIVGTEDNLKIKITFKIRLFISLCNFHWCELSPVYI